MAVFPSTDPSEATASEACPKKCSSEFTSQESQEFSLQMPHSYTLDVLRGVCHVEEQLNFIRCAWLLVGSRYMDTDDAVFAYNDASCGERAVAMSIPIDYTITKSQFLSETGGKIDQEIDIQRREDSNTQVAPRNLLCICREASINQWASESFDLIVDIKLEEVVSVSYTFNEDVFSAVQIRRIHRQLSHTLLQLQVQDDAAQIAHFRILNDDDKLEINSWNQVPPRRQNDSFDAVLRRHVLAQPQALAINGWDGSFTYLELDQLSDKFARYLIQSEVPGDPRKYIAICFEKSAFAVIAMIAIQKAGAAYVVLDPSHPADRLAGIVSLTQATTVISSQKQSKHIGQLVSTVITLDLPFLDQLPQTITTLPLVSPSATAYIQFTSGSTGEPKGVIIEHRSLCSVCGAHAYWKLGPGTRFLQFASYVFAASVVEIFSTLYYGGCICIPLAESQKDRLPQCIQDWDINTALMTPTGASLMHPDKVPGLRTLLLGGEAVTKAISSCWAGKVALFVGYGSSEATFGCTGRQIFEDDKVPQDVGKGINVRYWIADPQDHDQLLPVGCVGELLVEGPGLSAGYLNDPERTAKSFIANPKFLSGDINDSGHPRRLLKTGDLVRYSGAGSIIYIGRKDTQAKWNGIRIDLSEVAHCFKLSLKGSRAVVAEMISPEQLQGRTFLTAFVSLEETAIGAQTAFPVEKLLLPTTSEFQAEMVDAKIQLQKKVPHYMVPQLYVQVGTMPTNISGKTDRKSLRSLGSTFSPALIAKYGLSVAKESGPLLVTEQLLQDAWAEVLKIPANIIGNGNFFQLGGDSVTAMHLVARMQRVGFSLTVAGCFRYPQLSSMASIMEQQQIIGSQAPEDPEPFTLLPQSATSDFSGIKAHFSRLYSIDEKQIDDLYPCTPMQESLMALTMQNPHTYVCQNVISLPAEIDAQRFQKAWELIYQETPILRAILVDNEHGTLVMILARELVWNTSSDLHGYLIADKNAYMLYGDNLSRFAFIESNNGEHYLVWTWHHAILDGWALYQVLSRVMDAYNGNPLRQSPSFTRFSRYLLQCDKDIARNFWHSELAEARFNQFPQPLQSSERSQARTDSIIEHLSRNDFQAQGDFTMSTVLQAAWAMVVSAYSGTNDVIFGAVSAGRHAPILGILDIIGPTIATIPLHVRLENNLTVSMFLSQLQIQHASLMAQEHFGLQNIAKLGENYAQLCQFQNLLVIQPTATDVATLQGITLLPDLQHMSYNYPLIMECQLRAGSVKFRAQFDSSALSNDYIQGMVHHMSYITQQLVSDQSRRVKDIEMFSPRDETQISTWMQTEPVPQQVNECVHAVIGERSLESPDSEAICAWDGTFTYSEVEKWSDLFAKRLLALGLKSGTYVPICFEKSRWAVVAMLALIKCGAAYVVLDPSYPILRLQSIVKDVEATIIITSGQHRSHVEDLAATVITFENDELPQNRISDEISFPEVSPSSPVLIQFTSGSTGIPKGIVIQHAALCSSSSAHASFYGVGRNTRMFNFAAFAFDVSVADIWTTLMHGGCVCIPRDEDRYNNASKAIRELDANMSFLTPSVATLLDPKETPLKKLILGGERVTYGLVEKWADSVDLIACYGPAETCIYSSATLPLSKESNPASIGKPFGCRYWIVDVIDIDRLAPVGCVGELCIEGPILAKEYLNDPIKTVASFIKNPPWAKGGTESSPRRFYRTGDLVRYDSDGSVIFVARKDTQVKVSGQRVELAEVEHSLFTFKDVKSAAVLLPETGLFKSKLIAMAVLNGPTPEEITTSLQLSSILHNNELPNTISRLRKHLSSTLTPYMVPSFFVVVKAMPHNSSGKIDKNKLRIWLENADDETRQIIISQAATKTTNTPLTVTERKLQQLCAEVLRMGVEQISMNQDFISIGGDSISAIRLVMLARTAGIELKVKDIITSPSILDLCAYATNVDVAQEENIVQDGASHGGNAFVTSIGQELLHGSCRNSSDLANSGSSSQSLLVHLSQEESTTDLRTGLDKLVKRHPVLRSRFEIGRDGQLLQTIDKSHQNAYRFSEQHLEDRLAVEHWLQEYTAKLDIIKGPVFIVNVLRTNSGDKYLHFTAHDLVVDQGSWDILVDDLGVFLRERKMEKHLIPQYQSWAEFTARLGPRVLSTAYSNYKRYLFNYWEVPELYSSVSEWSMHSFILDPQVSAALAGDCNRLFSTEPDDLLIGGLLHSFASRRGSSNSPALLSGFDGRRISALGLDMSKTIGRFTIPMVFSPTIESGSSYLETVRRIKDTRCQCLQLSRRSTIFSATSSGKCDLSFHSEILSRTRAHPGRQHRNSQWESSYTPFNASVSWKDQNLEFNFKIDSGMDGFENVSECVTKYKELLTSMSLEMPNLSPRPTLVSYPLLALTYTYNDLEKLYSDTLPHFGVRSVEDVEDIFPCSPVQEGMLITRSMSSSRFYEAASILEVRKTSKTGIVDLDLLQSAWRRVMQHHPVLRTVFFESLSNTHFFDQAVLKSAGDNTTRIACSDDEVLAVLQKPGVYHENNTQSNHKMTICQTPSGRTFIKLELLHTCYDGHSTQIILRDLSAAYGNTLTATSEFPYSRYVSHLQNVSTTEDLEFWAGYLNGVRPCHLKLTKECNKPYNTLSTIPVILPDVKHLLNRARKQGLTVASLIKTAWSLVLRRYTHSDDVCFGFVASGRDTPIDGIGEGVGPYIKQLICRSKFDGSAKMSHIMSTMQSESFDCMAHQNAPLLEIQHTLGLSGVALFNTNMSLVHVSRDALRYESFTYDYISLADPAEYDITVRIEVYEDDLDVLLSYWNGAMTEQMASEVSHSFGETLSYLVDSATSTVQDVSQYLDAKCNRVFLSSTVVLDEFNDIQAINPKPLSMDTNSTMSALPTLRSLVASVLRLEESSLNNDINFFTLGGDSLTAMHLIIKAREQSIHITMADILHASSLKELLGFTNNRLDQRRLNPWWHRKP
ncbi:uncharacterized protein BP5553_09896 [Venustampulla echinocandica]|uniref:Carrier domain-containing protein n=1 Tax=Venustampulla echinocandica TaxID=2656787 RepID=A0A370TB00_9HELO|nr:uncharacterized protein BP5553_09896 [Venustampulla echinocandica]RDL31107.1 hypothetical protein BP5553_09896 [Venustampulla echinocandica]